MDNEHQAERRRRARINRPLPENRRQNHLEDEINFYTILEIFLFMVDSLLIIFLYPRLAWRSFTSFMGAVYGIFLIFFAYFATRVASIYLHQRDRLLRTLRFGCLLLLQVNFASRYHRHLRRYVANIEQSMAFLEPNERIADLLAESEQVPIVDDRMPDQVVLRRNIYHLPTSSFQGSPRRVRHRSVPTPKSSPDAALMARPSTSQSGQGQSPFNAPTPPRQQASRTLAQIPPEWQGIELMHASLVCSCRHDATFNLDTGKHTEENPEDKIVHQRLSMGVKLSSSKYWNYGSVAEKVISEETIEESSYTGETPSESLESELEVGRNLATFDIASPAASTETELSLHEIQPLHVEELMQDQTVESRDNTIILDPSNLQEDNLIMHNDESHALESCLKTVQDEQEPTSEVLENQSSQEPSEFVQLEHQPVFESESKSSTNANNEPNIGDSILVLHSHAEVQEIIASEKCETNADPTDWFSAKTDSSKREIYHCGTAEGCMESEDSDEEKKPISRETTENSPPTEEGSAQSTPSHVEVENSTTDEDSKKVESEVGTSMSNPIESSAESKVSGVSQEEAAASEMHSGSIQECELANATNEEIQPQQQIYKPEDVALSPAASASTMQVHQEESYIVLEIESSQEIELSQAEVSISSEILADTGPMVAELCPEQENQNVPISAELEIPFADETHQSSTPQDSDDSLHDEVSLEVMTSFAENPEFEGVGSFQEQEQHSHDESQSVDYDEEQCVPGQRLRRSPQLENAMYDSDDLD